MLKGLLVNAFRQLLQRSGHWGEFEAASLVVLGYIGLMLAAWYGFFLIVRIVKWAWKHA